MLSEQIKALEVGLCAVWPLNSGQSGVSWGLQSVCESGCGKTAAHVEKVRERKEDWEKRREIGCGRLRGS